MVLDTGFLRYDLMGTFFKGLLWTCELIAVIGGKRMVVLKLLALKGEAWDLTGSAKKTSGKVRQKGNLRSVKAFPKYTDKGIKPNQVIYLQKKDVKEFP